MLAGVRRIQSNWNVDVCEAEAALFGVKLAVRFGYTHIQLEGDSMNIVSTRFISSMIILLFYVRILMALVVALLNVMAIRLLT